MDCCLAMSAISLIIPPAGSEKTWFSFSFLAGIRIFRLFTRVHVILEMVERGSTAVKICKQFMLLLCFVYSAAMLLLTCEHLATPRDEEESSTTWGLFGSVLFVVSTLSTVGDTQLVPYTVL